MAVPYKILYRPPARKALNKLDKQVARRLLRAIEQLAENPRPPGYIQLQGGEGEMRVRVGHYRIIYEVVDSELIVLILNIGHRREVYRQV